MKSGIIFAINTPEGNFLLSMFKKINIPGQPAAGAGRKFAVG
jgi:hypothetical protein